MEKTGGIRDEFRGEASGMEITNPAVTGLLRGLSSLVMPTSVPKMQAGAQCTFALYQRTQSSINQLSGFSATVSAEAHTLGCW